MKLRLLFATAMISGLVVGLPAAASAEDIPSCVNDYWWAGQADQSYRCVTEDFGQCVNYYFWSGQPLGAYNCVVEIDPK